MTTAHPAPAAPDIKDVRPSEAAARPDPITLDLRSVSDDQFDEKRLRLLYHVSKMVTANQDLDQTLLSIVETARSLIQADMVGILLVENESMVLRASSGIVENLLGQPVPILGSVTGDCLMTRRALLVRDVGEDDAALPATRPQYDERHGGRCFIVAPLVCGSDGLGVLTIGDRNANLLSESDLALAVALAEHAAVAVNNARAYRDKEDRRAAADLLASELARRTEELERAQSQLVENEKVTAIGQLAAGIAHEINTPLSVVMSNLYVLDRYGRQLGILIEKVESALHDVDLEVPESVREAFVKSDAEYILTDLPSLTQRSMASAGRVAEIVRSMAAFVGKDADGFSSVDLSSVIDTALTLAWNRLKARAEIVRQMEPLPLIPGQASALTQLFLHLLVNAAEAMDDSPGFLTIEGRTVEDSVVVRISDTGRGIDPESLSRVFDPFYTTRPHGGGTGLGLSVCHGIVTRHGGNVSIESQPGSGTSVTVRFPLAGARATPLTEAA